MARQFGTRRLLWVISLLAGLLASASAVRASIPPLALFGVLLASAAMQVAFLVVESQRTALRNCVRGLVVGCATAILMNVMGGQRSNVVFLPFVSKVNPLYDFVTTPIGTILTAVGFSFACAIIAGSVGLAITGRRRPGVMCLAIYLLWLLVLALAIAVREPHRLTMQPKRILAADGRMVRISYAVGPLAWRGALQPCKPSNSTTQLTVFHS